MDANRREGNNKEDEILIAGSCATIRVHSRFNPALQHHFPERLSPAKLRSDDAAESDRVAGGVGGQCQAEVAGEQRMVIAP